MRVRFPLPAPPNIDLALCCPTRDAGIEKTGLDGRFFCVWKLKRVGGEDFQKIAEPFLPGLLLEIQMQPRQYIEDRLPGFVRDIQSSEYFPPVGERSESLLDIFLGLEVFVFLADLHDSLASRRAGSAATEVSGPRL